MKKGAIMLFSVAFAALVGVAQAQSLSTSLTCEYRENPVGIDVKNPRLGWKLQSDKRDVMQTAYEISVAGSAKDLRSTKKLIWSSGKVASDKSIHVEYNGRPLTSGERVYWRVRVWDNSGRPGPWSEAAYWEAGVDDSEWNEVEWITTAPEGKIIESLPSQYYRKEFKLAKKVARARVYSSALGVYHLFINGEKVSEDLFAPGWTSYHKRLQYQTYDVTDMLEANNSIGAMVGDGWYRGKMAWENEKRAYYGDQLGLIIKLKVEYTDGTEQVITTDGSWKYSYGPIVMSDWYDGETYDARKEIEGWNKVNYDDSKWKSVESLNYPKDHFVATTVELPQVIEEITPIKMFVTPKGEFVADLGQNIVGWVRFSCQGKSGDKITLQFGEVLDPDGNFYNENLRSADGTDNYILKGGAKETFEPHFTFHGFRYIKIAGVDKMPAAEDVVGVVIHTPMNKAGEFSTSDKLINQLQSNILWSHRDNFLDVPTDCPQRDERLGWTGDAQVFSPTATFNYNVPNFYTKWLRDLAVDQFDNGNVPHVIPDVLKRAGSSAWADAALIIPWVMYQKYGDVRILEEQYESMAKWIGYMENYAAKNKDFLWKGDFHYGDWLSHPSAVTEKDLIANAYFYRSTMLIAKIADVLGKKSDEERWLKLGEKVKAAFNKEYVTPNGRLLSATQTTYLMAINFGLLSESDTELAKKALAADVARKKHLTTGFVGTSLLCNTLSDIGRDDLAFMLFMRKQYPSWLYPVTMGATTIWERWDAILPNGEFNGGSMNSFNHYSYGAIGEWMYAHVAGIKSLEKYPAFKHFKLAPHVGGGLTEVSAKHESLYGEIVSAWQIVDGKFNYTISIPANTTADVVLPGAKADDVNINCTAGLSQNGSSVELTLGSGDYTISYPFNN